MGYRALYRKYRPLTFDQVKGQDHIIRTLKNIIESEKIGHAYIFSGPRGVGKTSVAKIFANILNCYHSDNKTVACDDCLKSINNNIDVIEMDAASNNGVDDIRELKDKVDLNPTYGKYKIYIIDEVHMLSKGAFNALLKTLEEPPAHVIFILATTDPQKIPLTILSRSQRFNFRRIPNKILSQQIEEVLKSEQISYENEAINYISRLAAGGMRDALSIADQSAMHGLGEIKLENIIQLFGVVSNDNLISILNASYDGNVKEVITLFANLKNSGMDPIQFVSSLMGVAKDCIVFEATKDENLLEVAELEEINLVRADLDFLKVYIENLYKLLIDLVRTSSPYQIIEFSLIKFVNKSKVSKTQIDKKTYEQDEFKTRFKEQLVTNPTPITQAETLVKTVNQTTDFNQKEKENNDKKAILELALEQAQRVENINRIKQMDSAPKPQPQVSKKTVDKPKIIDNNFIDDTFLPNYSNVPVEDEYQEPTVDFFKANKIQPIGNTAEIELEKPANKKKKMVEEQNTLNLFPTSDSDSDDTSLTEKSTAKQSIKEVEKFVDVYSVDEVVNAMMLSKKEEIKKYKELLAASSAITEVAPQFKEQNKIFQKLKILCANKNFLVVHDKNDSILVKIQKKQNNIWLQSYIKQVFGEFKTIIPVSKESYQEATAKYKTLKLDKDIVVVPIEPPKNIDKEGYGVELGKLIFGEDAEIEE